MQNSSARPYLLVFAIVALAAAGFILKQELSSTDKPSAMDDTTQTNRMLVEGPDGRVPEKVDLWFKRVGYVKLGFDNQADMDQTQAMLTAGRGAQPTSDQYKLIHKLVASQNPIPKQLGIGMLPGMRTPSEHKEFLPDVKTLFAKGSPNQNFRTILSTWYRGDAEIVKSLEKDPDKDLASFVSKMVTDIEYPGKDN
jgi:hypothetical protein